MTVQITLNENDIEILFKQYLKDNFNVKPEKFDVRTPDFINIGMIVLEFEGGNNE